MRYIFRGEKSAKAKNLPICQRGRGQSNSWRLTSRPPMHADFDSTITAAAPRYAATSVTAAAAATAASAATAATAASTCSAAAAAERYLREAPGAVFPVEDVERGETHVGDFLFVKNEALIGCGIQISRKVRSRKSGCRCASHQRQTQSGSA
jgi:hypothetical protein